MAQTNKVLKSVNASDGGRCVDIFIRPDGTYGFEEFRRDVEDSSGWFPIGGHKSKKFITEECALEEARKLISWFDDKVI